MYASIWLPVCFTSQLQNTMDFGFLRFALHLLVSTYVSVRNLCTTPYLNALILVILKVILATQLEYHYIYGVKDG